MKQGREKSADLTAEDPEILHACVECMYKNKLPGDDLKNTAFGIEKLVRRFILADRLESDSTKLLAKKRIFQELYDTLEELCKEGSSAKLRIDEPLVSLAPIVQRIYSAPETTVHDLTSILLEAFGWHWQDFKREHPATLEKLYEGHEGFRLDVSQAGLSYTSRANDE